MRSIPTFSDDSAEKDWDAKTHRGAGAWYAAVIVCETKSDGLPWTMARNASPTDEQLSRPAHRQRRIRDVGEAEKRMYSHVDEERGAPAVQSVLPVRHVCDGWMVSTSATVPDTSARSD